MTNNSCKRETSTHCFSSIIRQMVCGQNLPTHPSPCDPVIVKKPDEVTTCSNQLTQVQVQARYQAQGPSIVARLMGLESLPEATNSYESLFRSKSLNSLHFYPDFNPTRASFHRRARTSASFHEQSHNNLLVKVDEGFEKDGCLESKKPQKGSVGNAKQKREVSRESAVRLKGNERRISRKSVDKKKKKKRCEERFGNGESSSGSNRLGNYYNNVGYNNLRENNNNKNTNNEKRKLISVNKNNKEKNVKKNNGNYVMRKVDYNNKEEVNVVVEFQSDATSRSPVSVLDHHHHFHLFDSPTKENERQVSEEKRVPKSKKKDKSPKKMGRKQKLDVAEEQVAQYLVDFLAQICSVVEDHVRDPKWMTKYQRTKAHLTEELCVHFGDEMLDSLLLELMYELIE